MSGTRPPAPDPRPHSHSDPGPAALPQPATVTPLAPSGTPHSDPHEPNPTLVAGSNSTQDTPHERRPALGSRHRRGHTEVAGNAEDPRGPNTGSGPDAGSGPDDGQDPDTGSRLGTGSGPDSQRELDSPPSETAQETTPGAQHEAPSPQGPQTWPPPRASHAPVDEVVRWCAFSCGLVPLALLACGSSASGTLLITCGLAVVTAVCRLLLIQSVRARAEERGLHTTPTFRQLAFGQSPEGTPKTSEHTSTAGAHRGVQRGWGRTPRR